MQDSHKELYGEGYMPDPVTENAVAAAMAATESIEKEPSLWYKIIVVVGSILFVVAVASSGVTAVNAVENYHQNKILKQQTQDVKNENICLQKVVEAQQQDSQARVQISADDREAIDDLVQGVFKAKTSQEAQAAFAAYNKRRNENEQRRLTLPTVAIKCDLSK